MTETRLSIDFAQGGALGEEVGEQTELESMRDGPFDRFESFRRGRTREGPRGRIEAASFEVQLAQLAKASDADFSALLDKAL